ARHINGLLYTILKNIALDTRKKLLQTDKREGLRYETSLDEPRTLPDVLVTSHIEEMIDRKRAPERFSAERPEQYQLLMFINNGGSYAEAGDHFGIPLNTVKSRLAAAKLRLHKLLSEES